MAAARRTGTKNGISRACRRRYFDHQTEAWTANSLEAHAVKGIGKDHAKFSPVCSLGYRLLPEIRILKPITGDDAFEFQSCFPKGVIEVVKDKNGVDTARVANARLDTVSRECLRYPKFEDKVLLYLTVGAIS